MRKTKIKKVPATTNNITKAIINFLLYHGHSASRINVQGQYDERLKRWRKGGSRNGFFDIAACVKDKNGIGRFMAIDIKKGNDVMSDDQIKFKKEVERAGGVAIEVTGYDHFLTWFNNRNEFETF